LCFSGTPQRCSATGLRAAAAAPFCCYSFAAPVHAEVPGRISEGRRNEGNGGKTGQNGE